jgi:hypothetical protein
MALPIVQKIWQYTSGVLGGTGGANPPNSDPPNALSQNKQMLFSIKQMLLGSGSWINGSGSSITPANPFYIDYSSNGVTAGAPGDGVDRWTSPSDISWISQNMSWIVFKIPSFGSAFRMLIRGPGLSNTNTISFWISKVGFTGGTVSDRPTAIDEVVQSPLNWGEFYYGNTTLGNMLNTTTRINVLSSNDGCHYRIFISRGNIMTGIWMFERFSTTPSPLWNPPIFCGITGRINSVDTQNSAIFNSTYEQCNNIIGIYSSGSFSCALSGERSSLNDTVFGDRNIMIFDLIGEINKPNSFSNDYLIMPVGLVSLKTPGNQGYRGTICDLWWTNASAGSTFPGDGSKQFTSFYNLLVPWNGTDILL